MDHGLVRPHDDISNQKGSVSLTGSVRFNSYSVNDAIEFLARIKPKGIAGIVTSPPYNKAFNGHGKKPGSNWKNSKSCRKDFNVKTGAIMHRSKITLQQWAIGIYLMSTTLKGVLSTKLHCDLGITQQPVCNMAHKIRGGWDYGKTKLEGTLESDESYFDGKESNKHASKKLHAGGGTVCKVALVGFKQRDGHIGAKHANDTTNNTLNGQLLENVNKGSTLYSNDHKVYDGIDLFYKHETVKHSVSEYVKEQAHTNGIESFWALMKRGYDGTHHKVSLKHFLHRYVVEFAGRHNVYGLETEQQMVCMTRNFHGKRITYNVFKFDNGLNAEAS